MRIIGNRQWREFAATPEEALERGARLDAMDEEKQRRRQAWFQQHATL